MSCVLGCLSKVSVAALVLVIHFRCICVRYSPAHWIDNQKSRLIEFMAVEKQNMYMVTTIKVYGDQVHVGVFWFCCCFYKCTTWYNPTY